MSIIINGHYFRKKTSKHGLKISPIERITVLNISEDTAKVAKGHLAEGEKSQYIFDMKIDKIIEKPTTADYKLLVKEDKVKAKEKEHRSRSKAMKEEAYRKYLQRDKELRAELYKQGAMIPALSVFTNWELQNLRDNLNTYIPDLQAGIVVKVLGYDPDFDEYQYIQA